MYFELRSTKITGKVTVHVYNWMAHCTGEVMYIFSEIPLQGQLRINPKKYHEAFIPAPVSSTQPCT